MKVTIEILNNQDATILVDDVSIGSATYDRTPEGASAPWRAYVGETLLGDYETGMRAFESVLLEVGVLSHDEVEIR